MPQLFRSLTLLTLAVATGLLLAGPSGASMNDATWELGFGLGSANVDSSSEDFDLDLRADFRVGWLIQPNFEVEAQIIDAEATLDASVRALMVNALYNGRTTKQFVPYGLLGVGVSEIEDIQLFGGRPDLEDDGAAIQAAVGGRVFFGSEQRMALRLELSSLWLDTDVFDADRHTSLTAGLTWVFGSR